MENASGAKREPAIEPININEEFVKTCVAKTMKELGACDCEMCYANACAIALNALQPKYVTSHQGTLLKEIDSSKVTKQADITVEVTKAVMRVMEHPHH